MRLLFRLADIGIRVALCLTPFILAALPEVVRASPTIQIVHDNGPEVGLYEKFEIRMDIGAIYLNPFDPVEIDVRGVFTTPSGKRLVVPGFFHQEYTRSLLPDKRQVLNRVIGDVSWRVRYAPMELGVHSWVIEATDLTGVVTTSERTVTVVPSTNPGFVRADGPRFVFDNGDPFFPIGASCSWAQSLPDNQAYHTWGYGYESTYGFQLTFDDFYTYGANWNRIWVDTGEWATPSIESKKTYWNLYDWQVDRTVSRSGQNSALLENYAEKRSSKAEPFVLSQGDTLTFRVDGGAEQTLVFTASDFAVIGSNLASAYASDLATVIASKTALLTAEPKRSGGQNYLLIRARPAPPSVNRLEFTGGTALGKIGFDTSPAAPMQGPVLFMYKENGGDWRVDPGKTYTLSGWIKTDAVAADSNGGAFFGYHNIARTPKLTGTHGWTYFETTLANPTFGKLMIQGFLENAAGRAWFDDFSLKEVGSTVELGNDPGFEHLTLKPNRYNLPDSWALDLIFEMAELRKIYIQLMIGRHGNTPEDYQKYLRYIVARWGYSTSLLSIEFENENWHNVPWHDAMSRYLKQLDPWQHLRTTSLWSGLVIPNLWNLPELTLVNLHHYRRDRVTPRIWGYPEGHPRFDQNVFRSTNTSIVNRQGEATVFGPRLPIKVGKTYRVRYHVRGDGVSGSNGGNIRATWVLVNGTEIGAGQGPTLPGTYDWQTVEISLHAPAQAQQLRLYMESSGLLSGEVWIDDVEVLDAQNHVLFEDDFEFSDFFRREDWAYYGFEDGRMMRGYQFNKPAIGGEHGIEHDEPLGGFIQSYIHNGKANGASTVDVNSPDFRWDSEGIHFRNWLWGTAMGGMSGATGMWWYVNDSHRHYLALRRFIDAARDDFVLMPSHTSTRAGENLESSHGVLDAYGKVSAEHAYVYVLNRDYSWNRKIRDGVSPSPATGIITVKGFFPGTYVVREWDTHYVDTTGATSPILWESTIQTDGSGNLQLPVNDLSTSTAFSVETTNLSSSGPAYRGYR